MWPFLSVNVMEVADISSFDCLKCNENSSVSGFPNKLVRGWEISFSPPVTSVSHKPSSKTIIFQVIKNPITDHLPTGCKKIGTSFHVDTVSDVRDFVPNDEPVAFVVGAMAHGSVCRKLKRLTFDHKEMMNFNDTGNCYEVIIYMVKIWGGWVCCTYTCSIYVNHDEKILRSEVKDQGNNRQIFYIEYNLVNTI